jgi:hypothetical protein
MAYGSAVPGLGAARDREVTRSVRRYVEAYERELVSIVGIEDYAQSMVNMAGLPEDRDLRSELGWVYLPAVRQTVGLREVRRVDGADMPDAGRRLHRLLAAPADSRGGDGDIRALLEESARFNLGAGSRNFNFPTFPVIYLRAANRERSSWNVRSVDATHARVEFKEHARPTLVRTLESATVPARGSCRVESASGRIESCHVSLKTQDKTTTYEMDVTFALEPRLGLWLPSAMHDDYTRKEPGYRTPVHVTGEARYSDYRRFGTGARLVQ